MKSKAMTILVVATRLFVVAAVRLQDEKTTSPAPPQERKPRRSPGHAPAR